MNKTTTELSNLSKEFFESEKITREKGPGDDSLIFGLKRSNRRSHQQEIHKYGYQKACENFNERIGVNATRQQINETFRHIFEYENYDELIDITQDFSIKLFKALSIGPRSFEVNQEALKILDKEKQLTKDYEDIYSYLIMRYGDIEINVDNSSLSNQIKTFERPNKRVAKIIVKGKDCFLQTTDTDAMLGDLIALELATQEEIKNVFESMNKIL